MVVMRTVTETILGLGENLRWDVDEERLYWIDVFAATVYRCDLAGRDLRSWKFPGDSISSLALRKDGGALVTSVAGVYLFDFDSGDADPVFRPEVSDGFGFNDGTVDHRGRFITGMADGPLIQAVFGGRRDGLTPSAKLYRIDTDLSAHVIGDPIGVTNGPCLSPDGSTLYCGDSALRLVYAWDYDGATGETANRRTLARFTDGDAMPDGATVDDQGYLWVAAYQGGEVRRYAPDGTLDRRIPVPAAGPTSVAFAGPELDVLMVTSQGGGTAEHDGRILAFHNLGVRGLPERKFGQRDDGP
ncbi:SMP-30/gluconolactonase/LRE family protein [Yinghuangia sp. YIM S10712]|uniref:SMP-30/gluconolactonase/LRE family protein n=1 Tax=Yinghuangia sp. YIM S10712 TaxID=3436930 RepID=UPI003F5394B7